jgi:hypothetical protein
MVGTEESTARAEALRRLAQTRGRAHRPVEARATGVQAASGGQIGLAVELLLSTAVAALIAMTLVAASGSAVGIQDAPNQGRHTTTTTPRLQLRPDQSEDIDPRNPLVLCTVYETHTRCVPEET